jgi:glycosyltransferase involved in cell wall biosynthesis
MSAAGSETAKSLAWLGEFRRRHRRPLRVLHIGNIANNAYINALIQRRYGIEADVVCFDYYHATATPEWADYTFEGKINPDMPDWWATSLGGWRRPRWFAQGPVALCVEYLTAYCTGENARANRLWRQLERACRALARPPPPPTVGTWARSLRALVAPARSLSLIRSLRAFVADVRSAVFPFVGRWLMPVWRAAWIRVSFRRYYLPLGKAPTLRAKVAIVVLRPLLLICRLPVWSGARAPLAAIAPQGRREVAISEVAISAPPRETVVPVPPPRSPEEEELGRLSSRFAGLYDAELPRVSEEVRRGDFAYVEAVAGRWGPLLRQYDVVQGYSIDGYIPLYNGVSRYAAYEHGTLRTIPFEPTLIGRLCRLAYRHAAASFVTNVDVLSSAERLGLDGRRIVRLPHACDDARILAVAAANRASRPRSDGIVTFIAPARHHWSSGGPSWEKGNDRLIRATATLLGEGARLQVTLVEWGREVEASKALIAELGCQSAFRWVAPMNKGDLLKAFLEAHAVVNQFRVPGIGGVDFEALTVGCRLITFVEPAAMERFFGAAPPILAASSAEEIAAQMRQVIADPGDRAGIGRLSAEWARRYHSAERIVALQADAYRRLLLEEVPEPGLPAAASKFAEHIGRSLC